MMAGIVPIASSEIEPFPLKVTAARFPDVKQLGSVTEIDGGSVEPVDIITFGSPCQDLSVAGKQLGIHEGQRSNLFFEAVRIIKEMRKADESRGRTGKSIRPRFAVWENVPGAFSSNKGADFKAVLEALAGVIEADVSIPQPKRWDTGGGIVGNGWSLAWRVYDAQYWGVPQRRKRIYLVADFAGERAGEILFEREGVCGDSSQGGEAGEGTPNDAEGSAGGSGGVGIAAFMGGQGAKARSVGYCDDGTTPTLRAAESGSNQVPDVCYAIQGNMVDRDTNQNGPGYMEDDSPTLNTVDRHAVCYPETARALTARHDSSPCVDRVQNVVALAWANSGNAGLSEGDVAPNIKAARNGEPAIMAFSAGGGKAREYDGHYGNISPTIRANAANTKPAVCVGNGQLHQTDMGDKTGALNCMHDQQAVIYPGVQITSKVNRSNPKPGDLAPTLSTRSDSDYVVSRGEMPRKYIVRRLTPTECARLQGFPDEWCEGLGGSDSAIYKAYGNGLALPCAYDVMNRIARFVEHEKED
jgi:DNA (cytosine-5)-methyltransferase 1